MNWNGIAPTLGLALTLSLVACGRDNGLGAAEQAATTAPLGTPIRSTVEADTSVPDAATSFAAQDAAARAKALQDTAAALNKSGPPSTMTKEQESKAMPLPGQANDHSATARDDKKKAPPAR